jgi:hypothetical protein
MARPMTYTGDILEQKINDYFAYCQDHDRKPNKQGLAVYLNVCSDTVNEWLNNTEDKYNELSGSIKKAMDRMSDEYQQRTDAMAIISMKQPGYGGFIDRPGMEAKDIEIKLKLESKCSDPFA